MYIGLIKKISITKTEKICYISTNKSSNFIGIGGTNGYVQVISLDLQLTGQNQITFNKSLKYHTSDITIVAWNDVYNKLTTCDNTGIMVVWKFADSKWETEMINNREVSEITDVKWNKQGDYLCFIYLDGHAIVGTVEGNRSWGNDIRNRLYHIEWSPDGSKILLAAEKSNVLVLSASGQQMGELILPDSLVNLRIASMTWWSNEFSENRDMTIEKRLLIAFENGIVCLYDDECDEEPIAFKTILRSIDKAEWNVYGDLFTIVGKLQESGDNAVAFYSIRVNGLNGNSTEGMSGLELIRIITPPEPILSFSFDAKGTLIALATQNAVYFAIVKPKFKWCYFSNTLVYSYLSDKEHHTLVFWETMSDKYNYKYVKNMMDITAGTRAANSFCLITAKISKINYLLILSNSIGSPVDNKIINIEPVLIDINSSFVVASDRQYVYLWQFREYVGKENVKTMNIQGKEICINLLTQNMMREIVFFIEDAPKQNDVYNYESFKPTKKTKDYITALALNEHYLIVSCKSGKVFKYSLLELSNYDKFNFDSKVTKIGMSPSGKYAWIIDDGNILNIWDTEKIKKKKIKGEKINFEKKDVWSLLWSEEDELTFAFLEKNKLNIIKNLEPEEVLVCNGYLAEFSDLNITIVKIEDLMFHPTEKRYQTKDIVIKVETRILRDFREHINQKMSSDNIYKFASEHPNQKTWELLANYSLTNLDFATAEKALIHLNDYMGLSLIKRLRAIDDDNLRKAEIAKFYKDYDQAEDIYIQNDRKDLAIEMRLNLAQWDKVILLLNDSSIIQEDNIRVAYANYAEQFYDKKDYEKAEEFYRKANELKGLIKVWFASEQFDKASTYIDKLPEKSEVLLLLAENFEMYGLCEEAVNCYLKYGDPKRAIDTCVMLNKWNLAVELAEKNNFFQIEGLVNKFSSILIEKNKKMDLVELYRKAHRNTDAAKILIKIAEDLKELRAGPLTLKKIYVVAALEMESFKKRLIDAQITNITQQGTTNVQQTTTLDTLITSDLSNVSDKSLNNPWKGAEAYHFYMLCQSQIYQNEYKNALKTALRLELYEKELGALEVYRLIALSAYLNHSYDECSKALIKLENMSSISKGKRQKFKELSVAIFIKNKPKNLNEKMMKCPAKDCGAEVSEFDIDCKQCGSNFTPCVVSGQSILEKEYFKCKRCKHKSLKSEVIKKSLRFCALCHLMLDIGA